MKEKLTPNLAFNPTNWLQVLIVVVLILGVFFRLANLDLKVYWEDEAFTSLRISGYTEAELIQQVFNGHEIGVADLQKYQHPNPEKGVIDTIKGLAVEEPQHTPLYFIMVRLWVQWFGNSVVITRSLSVLMSLLVFPCLYWLCRELFESPLTAWIAMAMMAISPFHVVYAQEAREYSLWTLTIFLSSAALQIPEGFSDIFLYQPGKALRSQLKPNYKMEPIKLESVHEEDELWRLKKN